MRHEIAFSRQKRGFHDQGFELVPFRESKQNLYRIFVGHANPIIATVARRLNPKPSCF
jgi:hypothetical protein